MAVLYPEARHGAGAAANSLTIYISAAITKERDSAMIPFGYQRAAGRNYGVAE